jgi:hypothetical protein
MTDMNPNSDNGIAVWRAVARLTGRGWTDAAFGFGGADVAEAVGTPEEIGAELAHFLDSLSQQVVVARWLSDGFNVRLEVEPWDGGSTLADRAEEPPAEDPVPVWEASASSGNEDGVFDACYSFGNVDGDEGHLLGTAKELGAELARILRILTRQDVEDMKYGTARFYILLEIELPWRAMPAALSA